MSQQRGIRSEVITTRFHAPGPDGISKTAQEVVIVGVDGRDPVREHIPAVRLVTRENVTACHGLTLHHFEPLPGVPAGRVGYMASGAYVVVRSSAAAALGLTPRRLRPPRPHRDGR